jgi:hypothetical protein
MWTGCFTRVTRAAVALAALVTAAAPRPAAATMVGDPTLHVGQGRFAAGLEAELGLGGDIETDRFFLKGDYGFAPDVDGFARLGLFTGDEGPADIDGFGLGGGARFTVLREREWRFGGLGQIHYFTGEATIDIPGIPPFFPPQRVEEDFDWVEIEAAGAASYRGAGQVVPYFGLKLGIVTGDPDTELQFTPFGGATVAVTPQLTLGGELRIIDDAALGVFARWSF